MIVSDQKETESQPSHWLNTAETVAFIFMLIMAVKLLWDILILIVKIETAYINTLDDVVFFVIFCIFINTILFYIGILACKD